MPTRITYKKEYATSLAPDGTTFAVVAQVEECDYAQGEYEVRLIMAYRDTKRPDGDVPGMSEASYLLDLPKLAAFCAEHEHSKGAPSLAGNYEPGEDAIVASMLSQPDFPGVSHPDLATVEKVVEFMYEIDWTLPRFLYRRIDDGVSRTEDQRVDSMREAWRQKDAASDLLSSIKQTVDRMEGVTRHDIGNGRGAIAVEAVDADDLAAKLRRIGIPDELVEKARVAVGSGSAMADLAEFCKVLVSSDDEEDKEAGREFHGHVAKLLDALDDQLGPVEPVEKVKFLSKVSEAVEACRKAGKTDRETAHLVIDGTSVEEGKIALGEELSQIASSKQKQAVSLNPKGEQSLAKSRASEPKAKSTDPIASVLPEDMRPEPRNNAKVDPELVALFKKYPKQKLAEIVESMGLEKIERRYGKASAAWIEKKTSPIKKAPKK